MNLDQAIIDFKSNSCMIGLHVHGHEDAVHIKTKVWIELFCSANKLVLCVMQHSADTTGIAGNLWGGGRERAWCMKCMNSQQWHKW